MHTNGTGPRWYLIVRPDERELFEVLKARLEGSGVEVLVDRRSRERRRGSLGPAMDRRSVERRRQRPIAVMSVVSASEGVAPTASASAATAPPPAAAAPLTAARPQAEAVRHRCPTCAESVELELPRFPHPPARVEMEVGHTTGNGRDGHHYAEIAAFTVSGRLILSQRVPARRPA
jgi:hypothetical protein